MFILVLSTILRIGSAQLYVEIASTTDTRNLGLMHRESLPENHGMLFVYDAPETLSFWMKNTRIPLTIGFFNAEKILLQTEDMDPPKSSQLPLRVYKSSKPALYALEVPQHWFIKNKISIGDKFSLQDVDESLK